jgi:hypothetical protein
MNVEAGVEGNGNVRQLRIVVTAGQLLALLCLAAGGASCTVAVIAAMGRARVHLCVQQVAGH